MRGKERPRVGWAEVKPHLEGHWEYTQRLVTDQFELSNTYSFWDALGLGIDPFSLKSKVRKVEIPKVQLSRCYIF